MFPYAVQNIILYLRGKYRFQSHHPPGDGRNLTKPASVEKLNWKRNRRYSFSFFTVQRLFLRRRNDCSNPPTPVECRAQLNYAYKSQILVIRNESKEIYYQMTTECYLLLGIPGSYTVQQNLKTNSNSISL